MILTRYIVRQRQRKPGIIDIWRIYGAMKKSGKIKYPMEYDKRLFPRNLLEICTICWICCKVVFDKEHFKSGHPELNYHDNKALKNVGRAMFNRLSSPGIKSLFSGTKNKKTKLLQTIHHMYANHPTKSMGKPKTTARQGNSNATRCNIFLDLLRKNHPLGRKVSISMEQLEVNRVDLDNDRNLFCVYCGRWFDGRWTQHKFSKHKKLSRLENEIIRLYSNRIKAVMLQNVLLVNSSLIKEVSFFKKLEKNHFLFVDEVQKVKRSALRGKKRRLYVKLKRKIVSDDRTITWFNLTSAYEEPIYTFLMVKAYKRIKSRYARKIKGFTDAQLYDGLKSIPESTCKKLAKCCPAGVDSMNILSTLSSVSDSETIDHMVFAMFNTADKTINVYEGNVTDVYEPIKEPLKMVLEAHYQHIGPELRAGYVLGYSPKIEEWGCSYRAFFSLIAALSNKDPSHYEPRLLPIFKIVKFAVEFKGCRLSSWTLPEIWRFISKEKKKKPQLAITYEPLNK